MVISKKKKFAIFLLNLLYSLKKIKVFTLNRSCIEYFGKHCCKITYKRSLIVLYVYFFSLFPIAPLFSYRPLTAPFLLTVPLNLANAPWGAVAPTLETTALNERYKFVKSIKLCQKCLSSKHRTPTCKRTNTCGVDWSVLPYHPSSIYR